MAAGFLAAMLAACSGGGGGGGGDGGSKDPVTVRDLGTYTLQAGGSPTGPIDVPIDARATSFGLVATIPEIALGFPSFVLLSSPTGIDLVTPSLDDRNLIWVGQFADAAQSILIPNSQRYPFETGTFETSLAYDADFPGIETDVSLQLVTARRAGLAAGVLDVNFFFASIPGLDAASAPSNANFQKALGVVSDIYARAGVAFGNVGYIDLPPGVAEALALIDLDTDEDGDSQSDDLEALFSQSGILPAESRALNFFLIREFTSPGVLGIAGGVPGPFFLAGLPTSGVAAAAGSIGVESEAGITLLGETIAHEGLHYLGLFHLSERGGQAHDLIDDTPECRGSTDDVNGDGMIDTGECWNLGADNSMFWSAAPIRQTVVSPGQAWVVQRSPLVRDGAGSSIGTAPPAVPKDGDGAYIYIEDEPNELGSGRLGVAVTIEGQAAVGDDFVFVEPEGDGFEDVYSLVVRDGETVSVRLEPQDPSTTADLDLYVLRPSLPPVIIASSTTSTSNEALDIDVLGDQDWLVAVSAWTGSAAYRLRIR